MPAWRGIPDAHHERTEQALLRCCARTWAGTEKAARITTLVEKEFDWEYLFHLARWHGLLPLVFWQLQDVCAEAVPARLWQQLRAGFEANARRNLRLTAELRAFFRLFATHHLPAIALKGPALAMAVLNRRAWPRPACASHHCPPPSGPQGRIASCIRASASATPGTPCLWMTPKMPLIARPRML